MLDALSLAGVRTTDMNKGICEKVLELVRDAGNKKSYEKWGRYITKL